MSSPRPPSPTIEAHPPERRRSGAPVVLPCGCCCCCCCCLHSIGGVVGGVIGSLRELPPRPRSYGENDPFPFRRDEFEDEGGLLPASALYWMAVSFTIVATAGGWFVNEVIQRSASGGDLLIGFFIALLVLPGLQFVASLVAMAVVALFYSDRTVALQRIVKITLYSLAGTGIGTGVMAAGCGVLWLSSRL